MASKLNSRFIKSLVRPMLQPKVPKRISGNFLSVDDAGLKEIEKSLKSHYFSRPMAGESLAGEDYLATADGKKDLLDHLTNRLVDFRQSVIPWLNEAKPLSGSNVLEIGCGTGTSSIALAEQGAKLTSIDIDDESIQVARDRGKVYGLDIEFCATNATEVYNVFKGRNYDFIIFFATLEHMTNEERLSAMRTTWDMLSEGGLWCVIDTPNRLWYDDGHTSWLPFYTWLPDDLALQYSKFSPRKPFCDSFREQTDQGMMNFLRQGRGVSYHEFDLSMKKVEELDVLSSLRIWRRQKNWLWNLARRFTLDHRFESMLVEIEPKIHRGFYQATLDLIIRKH
jgi:2-polyprenyl-3-methyl-5-hydroxy-6-metoxy-1,4-benzoquinol methylase